MDKWRKVGRNREKEEEKRGCKGWMRRDQEERNKGQFKGTEIGEWQ